MTRLICRTLDWTLYFRNNYVLVASAFKNPRWKAKNAYCKKYQSKRSTWMLCVNGSFVMGDATSPFIRSLALYNVVAAYLDRLSRWSPTQACPRSWCTPAQFPCPRWWPSSRPGRFWAGLGAPRRWGWRNCSWCPAVPPDRVKPDTDTGRRRPTSPGKCPANNRLKQKNKNRVYILFLIFPLCVSLLFIDGSEIYCLIKKDVAACPGFNYKVSRSTCFGVWGI